jgi:hypothetical protein
MAFVLLTVPPFALFFLTFIILLLNFVVLDSCFLLELWFDLCVMVMKVRGCSRPLWSFKYVWRVLDIGFDISWGRYHFKFNMGFPGSLESCDRSNQAYIPSKKSGDTDQYRLIVIFVHILCGIGNG